MVRCLGGKVDTSIKNNFLGLGELETVKISTFNSFLEVYANIKRDHICLFVCPNNVAHRPVVPNLGIFTPILGGEARMDIFLTACLVIGVMKLKRLGTTGIIIALLVAGNHIAV